jgi:hypothetical protein
MELAPPEGLMEQLRASSRAHGVLPPADSNMGAVPKPAGCIGAYAAILTWSHFFPAFISVIASSSARHSEHDDHASSIGALSAALASLRVSAAVYRAGRDAEEAAERTLPTDAIVASLVQIAQQVYRHTSHQVRHLPTSAGILHCMEGVSDAARKPQCCGRTQTPPCKPYTVLLSIRVCFCRCYHSSITASCKRRAPLPAATRHGQRFCAVCLRLSTTVTAQPRSTAA